jgi:hypothetical protein
MCITTGGLFDQFIAAMGVCRGRLMHVLTGTPTIPLWHAPPTAAGISPDVATAHLPSPTCVLDMLKVQDSGVSPHSCCRTHVVYSLEYVNVSTKS